MFLPNICRAAKATHVTDRKIMKRPIFQLNSWRKMFVQHYSVIERSGMKTKKYASGQEKVAAPAQHTRHLIFECKKWFFFGRFLLVQYFVISIRAIQWERKFLLLLLATVYLIEGSHIEIFMHECCELCLPSNLTQGEMKWKRASRYSRNVYQQKKLLNNERNGNID